MLYALRDDYSDCWTVFRLIAASIMSKNACLRQRQDLYWMSQSGSGAFMKNIDDAICLAQRMVEIGEMQEGRPLLFLLIWDVPLGEAVGNDIEVVEAIETLQGKGPEDFRQICVEFAAYMLYLGEIADLETSR